LLTRDCGADQCEWLLPPWECELDPELDPDFDPESPEELLDVEAGVDEDAAGLDDVDDVDALPESDDEEVFAEVAAPDDPFEEPPDDEELARLSVL
jgi:hypothetical protein